MPGIICIKNQKDLEEKLEECKDKLVVIDFFATWCGPCVKIAPQYEALPNEHKDCAFFKVDVNECEDIAAKYEISSMPTFLFIKNKKVEYKFTGANFDRVKSAIQKYK